MGVHVSLDELPKKIQYIIIDSSTVNGEVNNFSTDISLESNLHVEDMNKVIGVRLVDFCLSQISSVSNVITTRYIDVLCPDIPKKAQMLDETKGQVLARIPLEYSHSANGSNYYKDVHEWGFLNSKKANYFNPISIQKLHFQINERLTNGTYRPLVVSSPRDSFYMVLEITSVDHKEKPKDRDIQILQALNTLIIKIDELNANVVRIPTKQEEEEERKKKKYPFSYLLLFIALIIGLFLYIMKPTAATPVQ